MELLDRKTFFEWMEQLMSHFDKLKQTILLKRMIFSGTPYHCRTLLQHRAAFRISEGSPMFMSQSLLPQAYFGKRLGVSLGAIA